MEFWARTGGSSEYKAYVKVKAVFDSEGQVSPVGVWWEDGTYYAIDKVVDVRPAASLKAGGCGIRYTCKVRGKQTYLYREEDRWFMERKKRI